MTKDEFRIVFIGALTGGKKCLKALLDARENVAAVFTWSDGAGKERSCYEPFDELVAAHGIPLVKVNDINAHDVVEKIRGFKPSVIVVMCWSQMVKKSVIEIPAHGTIGMHPTLLPKNRGRAPIPWAIIKGLDKTGVTIFYINERVDAGDILAQEEILIDFEDTAKTLGEKVDMVAEKLLCRAVREIREGKAKPIPQDNSQATYWPKRNPEDGLVNWAQKPIAVYNFIRALVKPYPGAFTFVSNKKLLLWNAKSPESHNHRAAAGQILKFDSLGMKVATNGGSVWINSVELDGDKERNGEEVKNVPELREGLMLGR